jgi:hypothetical protein
MRILSFLILLVFLWFAKRQTSPHGADFKISCGNCHSTKGWQIDKEIYSFDHGKTSLPLVGQHTEVNCRQCHPTLVFSEAKTECNECHTDVHQATTGLDCGRCHTPVSWLVNNITEIHQMSRFPLLGAHRTADCSDCHKSETLVRFDVPGVNCIDCHRENYMSTTNPNHLTSGFSEDCSTCHPVNSFSWTGAGFNHNFFPLSQGHSGISCSTCHKTSNYADANPECYGCHQQDYASAKDPDHIALNFPLTCQSCHDLTPGWKPASFKQHDASFPIFSGTHNGTWNSCTECHPNASNYSSFTCLSCHEHNKSDMDNAHREEGGYSYDSAACLHCHPDGSSHDK